MESKMNDGGRAFPTNIGELGMSLRQWYAGQAMVGLCLLYATNPDAVAKDSNQAAQDAFALADALIAAESGKATP